MWLVSVLRAAIELNNGISDMAALSRRNKNEITQTQLKILFDLLLRCQAIKKVNKVYVHLDEK